MDVQRWICFSNKSTFVKIVHPGGHVELHDRPVLASEILNRNPKSYIAHPNIFRQPWAIVAPETTLMPGQKFYVMPKHTLQRLQSLTLESSPAMVPAEFRKPQDNGENNEKVSTCGLLRRNGSSKSDNEALSSGSDGCFGRWLTGFRIIARSDRDEMKSWSSFGSSEMKALCRKNGSGMDSTSAAKMGTSSPSTLPSIL